MRCGTVRGLCGAVRGGAGAMQCGSCAVQCGAVGGIVMREGRGGAVRGGAAWSTGVEGRGGGGCYVLRSLRAGWAARGVPVVGFCVAVGSQRAPGIVELCLRGRERVREVRMLGR